MMTKAYGGDPGLPTVRSHTSPWAECRRRPGFPYEAVIHEQEAEQRSIDAVREAMEAKEAAERHPR